MTAPGGYLLIESQGTWAGPSCRRFFRDAAMLAEAGRDQRHQVWLLLIQDGVAAALPGTAGLSELIDRGGQVWVDGFSLAQRALGRSHLAPGTRVVGMDDVVDTLLARDVRVVWH